MKIDEKSMRLHWLYNETSKILNDENADEKALGLADSYIAEATGLKLDVDAAKDRQEKMNGLKVAVEGEGRKSSVEPKDPTPVHDGKWGFKSFGEFLVASYKGTDPRLQFETKDLAEAGGPGGGFLVPPDFRAQLLQVMEENAVVRPRATVLPMTSRQLTVPSLDQTTAMTAGDLWSAYLGGVYVEWTEEAAQKPQHEPQFRDINLTAHKMTAYMRSSDELLADSAIALEAVLTNLMGRACAWMEDYAFLRGTGVGQPLGVINAPCTIATARTGGGNAVDAADIFLMLARLMPGTNPIWVVGPSVKPSLYGMVDAGNHAIWIPNMREGEPSSMMGYPVVYSEKLPLALARGDILLADFSYYLIGDRQSATIASSTHERFRFDQTSWRVTQRLDGQPWLSADIDLNDGTTTVSPFVVIAA